MYIYNIKSMGFLRRYVYSIVVNKNKKIIIERMCLLT